MNTNAGTVEFGGKIAYCQQNGGFQIFTSARRSGTNGISAWIQNATLRDNVLFGREWDEHRYWKSLQDASLLPDLEILPDGDLTEVGFQYSSTQVMGKELNWLDRRERCKLVWR